MLIAIVFNNSSAKEKINDCLQQFSDQLHKRSILINKLGWRTLYDNTKQIIDMT